MCRHHAGKTPTDTQTACARDTATTANTTARKTPAAAKPPVPQLQPNSRRNRRHKTAISTGYRPTAQADNSNALPEQQQQLIVQQQQRVAQYRDHLDQQQRVAGTTTAAATTKPDGTVPFQSTVCRPSASTAAIYPELA